MDYTATLWITKELHHHNNAYTQDCCVRSMWARVITYTLKVPRNPNACWLLLIRSDVYTTYRLTLGYKCVSYILWYFFNNFCQICYAPPPKKPSKLRFLRWHHLSIISQLAYLEHFMTMVCLFPSTDNLFTIALHFHSMAVHKHAWHN